MFIAALTRHSSFSCDRVDIISQQTVGLHLIEKQLICNSDPSRCVYDNSIKTFIENSEHVVTFFNVFPISKPGKISTWKKSSKGKS